MPIGRARRIPSVRLLVTTIVAAVVAAPPTFEGGPLVVRWMTAARLGGEIPSGRERERFVVEQRECGRTWEPETTFFSGRGGRWQLDFYPTITTSYRVRWDGAVSRTLTVRVRPSVVVRESFPKGRLLVVVTATREFERRRAFVQRLDRRTGRWTTMKTLRFTDAGQAGQMRVTRGYVTVDVPRGTLVRALLPKTSVQPCYLAGYSNVFATT